MDAAPSSPSSSSSSSSLPWTWIFEYLIGQKEIGTPILREMALAVPRIAFSARVQRKLALRYLEEAISAEKVDASLIVLIENLLEHSQRTGFSSFPTSLDYSHLLFRVKLETVLMHIRTNPRRWHIFSQALDLQFPGDSKDAQYREKRKQLRSLSELDDEKKIMELLEEFPVSTLRCDILKCLTSEKCRLEEAFLDKLLWDVHTGKCPVAVGLSSQGKNESEEVFHSADITGNTIQSDEQTDMDAVETRHGESFAIELEKSRPKNIVKDSAERSGSEGQEKLCHKCKKGGILVCCEGCPIAVHQLCLESDANIVSGEWFCPLCIERKAAEVLAKAKEEEIAAKEKAARFLAEMEAEKTAVDGNADDHAIKIHEMNMKKSLRRRKAVGQTKASLNASAAAVCICTDIPEESRSPDEEFHETAGESSLKKRSREDVTCGAILDDVGGTPSKAVRELPSAVQATEPQGVDGDGHDGDIEEDNQDRGRRNRNVNRKQKLKMRMNRLIPGLRRKRLPWSKEEEDALKEGVKKFSHDGTWGFQWTRILDYGRGKFHPSRTDIDLKDKWRNLKDKAME